MEKGRNVKGRLTPLYEKVGGRDELARLTGITGNTLSAYNGGTRPLGERNARRIAAGAEVSLETVWGADPDDLDRAWSGSVERLVMQLVALARPLTAEERRLVEAYLASLRASVEAARQVEALLRGRLAEEGTP